MKSQNGSPADPARDFLAGGGEMGALARGFDWRRSPLGPPEFWPRSLKTAVRIMLTSRQPIWIGWGGDLTYLYNDPYKSIIGGKHPWALGRPTAEVWREIWDDIGPMLATAMKGDEGTYVEEQLLIMERSGYPEETYYTFSYSPIPDDDGAPGGIICANTDDTRRVIGERQLTLLRELAAATADARTVERACRRSAQALATDPKDLPFAMIYLAEPDGRALSLAGSCGIAPNPVSAPQSAPFGAPAKWPFATAIHGHQPIVVSNLDAHFGAEFPKGAWEQSPSQAALIPIPARGVTARAGVLVAGLNPFRLFDDDYRRFLGLVAGEIGASIANAQAYEEERRRADALAELDKAKTLFFSNVSHEFRTPLALMLGPIEEVLAKPDRVFGEHRRLIEIAHRNGVRLLKLVNTLLDFSRLEAGRAQASYEPVDLAVFTAELASNFRSAVERADLRLIIDCPPLPSPVHVDRDMWEKIVLNLVSNAFKFTFEGEIAVEARPSADGGAAEISVRDTGTGIAVAEIPRLFERFRRVEGARGRSFEGSGIGLALVQELVRLHGGTIKVESELGRGSRFTVTLPFGVAHLPADRIGAARSQTPTSIRAQSYVDEALGWIGEGQNSAGDGPLSPASDDLAAIAPVAGATGQLVLLADDNADMRHYVQRLLATAGFRVEAASDGEAALALARRVKPDLVISDIMMPKLDGFGLLSALRNDPELREIPALLLSARAGEEAKVEGLKSGADDYLTKPFSARELLARVETNLRLARLREESARALREEAQILEKLNEVGTSIAAELDLERAVQVVTEAATALSGAAFGAFFYTVADANGEALLLYALSGAPREAFANFPNPRNTQIFGPTFRGEAVMRSPDITQDPRFGKNPPYYGMPKGHLPVRSYLAAPVFSHSGEVIGGLFFGHPEAGRFDERAERLVAGIAIQAGIAIDKARLYRSAQQEIDQRKQTEAALRESEESLERKVEERTAELQAVNDRLRAEAAERARAEDALRQAQKMESIGQLTGGVAHDFNNLLTVISGNLETIRRHLADPTHDPATLERAADNAMRGAQRAASLTHRLLAFSRQQPLEPKPLDVSRLVNGMSDLLRRTLGEQVAIETVLAGGLWRVHADPNQLEVALINLAVNARDAMPEGGKLTIETANAYLDENYAAAQAEIAPGQYVVVAVTDNGAGMSREIIARAFEPFFTTKGIGQGTGLGLSQVYGFVKQSGGHVKIYSEVGHGTTVKIYLPRYRGADAAADVPPLATKAPRAARSETILVVEDDDDVRSHTTALLRELGYDVVEAPDGEAALRALQVRSDIILLFTDVGLPGRLNGRQLAEEARRLRSGLKALFTTGYARNAIVHDGRLDPGVQLITKPFTYAALAAKLRDVLDAGSPSGRILLVEDEALLQLFAVDLLEELGFKVDTASTATEALNKLRLVPGGLDAAIVDIGLPDRQGDALVPEFRALYPSLPIVIASGQDEQSLREQMKAEINVSVLGKPYSKDQVEAALREVGAMPRRRGDAAP